MAELNWRSTLIILLSLLVLTNATVTTYNFNDATSGRIQKLSLTYTASIHWGNMTIQSNPLLSQIKRVYYQIDTSGLPDDAVIDLVEMNYQDALSQPTTQCLATDSYIGSWIGNSLDGTAADFNGGNQLFNDILVYGPNNWFDMGLGGVDPTQYVNKQGTTDIRIDCVQSDNLNRQHVFEKAQAKTQFRITWHNAPVVSSTPKAVVYNIINQDSDDRNVFWFLVALLGGFFVGGLGDSFLKKKRVQKVNN